MGLKGILKKAAGDFRHNKSASFKHGVKITKSYLAFGLLCLSGLVYLDVIAPRQLLQGTAYVVTLFVADYGLIRDVAFGLRFVAPDLFGFLSLSYLVTGVTVVGALSIAFRWERSQ